MSYRDGKKHRNEVVGWGGAGKSYRRNVLNEEITTKRTLGS